MKMANKQPQCKSRLCRKSDDRLGKGWTQTQEESLWEVTEEWRRLCYKMTHSS